MSLDSIIGTARSNPAPVMVVDDEGHLVFGNEGSWMVREQWGIDEGALLPESWRELAARVLETGNTEHQALTAGYLSLILVLVPHSGARSTVIYGIDVTQSKQTEKDLKIKAHVQAQAHEAIVVTDDEFRTMDLNPAYTALTGFTEADALGEAPSFLKAARKSRSLYLRILDGLQKENRWHGEIWDRSKDGRRYAARVSISAIHGDGSQVTHYVTVMSDVTKQKAAEEELYRLAHYDSLTGLPNRKLFGEFLRGASDQAERTGEIFALMVVDIDGFKMVNDTLGHAAGDRLLALLSTRMQKTLRKSDRVARFGGDEFAILARNLGDPKEAENVARKISAAVSEPCRVEDQELFVTASIGIALYPRDQKAIEPLMGQADKAMYKIKKRGKNGILFFSEDIDDSSTQQVQFLTALRHAVQDGDIDVHFQPQVRTDNGKILGMEALARWTDRRKQPVPPGRFIPVAEESGLIESLGRQVRRKACLQAARWAQRLDRPVTMGVNVSVREMLQEGFVEDVQECLENARLDPGLLELELTESIFIEDASEILSLLQQLSGLGIRLSIDDFGKRYASLLYIKTFPVERIKIDASFIRDVAVDRSAGEIVTAIVAMARSLGCEVIAEGVETAEQLEFLRSVGCMQMQGYYCSPPLPADRLEEAIARGDCAI